MYFTTMSRLLVAVPSMNPSKSPSRIHRRQTRSPSYHRVPEKNSPANQSARQNQVNGTRILIVFVISIAYMICVIAIIQKRRRRRIEEARRIIMTSHPSRPLHPISQEAVVI